MKTESFSLLHLNKFTFGDQPVSQFVVFEWKYLFSIIFFYFHKSTGAQDRFHTHAFNAISFKLFGEYDYSVGVIRRTQFIKYFPREHFHRIANSNGCMTLLLSGPWNKEWKEYRDGTITGYSWGRKKV
mgnify:CR=1 FL=1